MICAIIIASNIPLGLGLASGVLAVWCLQVWRVSLDWFVFAELFVDLEIKNLPKIGQESIEKVIKNKMRFWMHLGWLLERLLVDFGSKLGVKLEPSWHPNRRKWDTKTMSTNHQKSGDARVREWSAVVGGPGP